MRWAFLQRTRRMTEASPFRPPDESAGAFLEYPRIPAEPPLIGSLSNLFQIAEDAVQIGDLAQGADLDIPRIVRDKLPLHSSQFFPVVARHLALHRLDAGRQFHAPVCLFTGPVVALHKAGGAQNERINGGISSYEIEQSCISLVAA